MEQQPEAEQRPDPRVYVACLAAYNDGILHGRFVRAVDEDEVWDGIREVLTTSPIPNAEEHAFHDHDGFEGIRIGEYDTVRRVAALGRLVAEHGKAFAVFYEEDMDVDDLDETFQNSYIGAFESERELEDHFYTEFGLEELEEAAHRAIPDWAASYVKFDVEQYLHDLKLNGDINVTYADGRHYAYWAR